MSPTQSRTSPIRDGLSGAVLIAIAVYVTIEASGFRGNSGFLPTMLSLIMAGGGLLLLVGAVLAVVRAPPGDGAAAAADPDRPALTLERVLLPLAVFVVTFLFILLISRIGYYLGATVFILAVLAILGIRSWIVYLATAGLFVVLLYVVFDTLLKVSFPAPTWF